MALTVPAVGPTWGAARNEPARRWRLEFSQEHHVHVVTKILIVLAALLSVLLAALTMAFSFNADRITTAYKDQALLNQALRDASGAQIAEAGAREREAREQLEAQTQLVRDLQRQLAEQRQALVNLETRARAAEVARDTMQQQMGQFRETVSSLTSLVAVQREEVSGLRQQELALRRRSIELEDRNSELVGQLEVLSQDLRAVRELLAQTQLERETVAVAGPGAADVVAGPLIQGRVLEVMRDRATGGMLVRISVGANDRVRDNMTLNVVRGNQFVGKITILTTDLQYAVGKFDPVGQPTQVAVDDMVLSRLR